MTVGSGQRLFALLRNAGPIGSFSRILLASSTWASTEYFLSWRHSATKSRRRLIFRLVPWTARSSDIESGLWATPRAEDSEQTGAHGHLATWPTPASRDTKGAKASQATMEKNSRPLNEVLCATWPTPVCPAPHDSEASCARGRAKRDGVELRDLVNPPTGTWPTPKANAQKAGTDATRAERESCTGGPDLQEVLGIGSYGCLAQMGNFVERLTNLSSWLMGYTAAYLRHWETASSGRSRKKSSEPFRLSKRKRARLVARYRKLTDPEHHRSEAESRELEEVERALGQTFLPL